MYLPVVVFKIPTLSLRSSLLKYKVTFNWRTRTNEEEALASKKEFLAFWFNSWFVLC